MKKLISSVLLLCMLLPMLSFSAFAEVIPDTSRENTLTVDFRYGNTYIGGGDISLYMVAEALIENESLVYSYTDDFSGSDIDLSKDAEELINDIGAYIAENPCACITEPISEKGTAVFEELKCGYYFAVQNSAGEGYIPATPFIIELPAEDEKGIYSYNAIVNAKVSPKSDDTETTPTTDTKPGSGGKLPQTGQLKWPVPVLIACGLGSVVIGVVMINSAKKSKNEK